MKSTVRARVALFTLAPVAALAACVSHPVEHFYTVSSGTFVPDSNAARPRMVVYPIAIPSLIDRPELVLRTAEHEIVVLDNHRWAEPLSLDLTRVLVRDLRQLQPGLDVVAAEASQSQDSQQILDLTITELIVASGVGTSLQASWHFRDRARNCDERGSVGTQVPGAGGFEEIPSAYAVAISRLADAIAKAIQEGHACSGL